MSFVRIYQGRVTSVREVLSEKKLDFGYGEEMEETCLTRFHELYTDAVNYYLLAIGAMVRGSEEEKLKNYVERIEECWKPYSKKGKSYEGLRAGFQRSFGLEKSLTFQEACDLILKTDDPIDSEIYRLAGESLLFDLGGEGKIQQGSKTYLPLFCVAKSTANFPRGEVNRLKSEGKVLLPSLLWSEDRKGTLADLFQRLPFEYFANPNTNGSLYKGEEARQRLCEAVEEEEKHGGLSPDLVDSLKAMIKELPDELSYPRYTGGSVNKEALLRRLNLYLLLRYVSPSEELFERLKSLVKKPAKFVSEYQMTETEKKLHQLGEDPIKLARGERGYVFPAFSSLKIWKDAEAGVCSFKGFDIQAFAEALKGISQYQMMTDKRVSERILEKARIDWIRGVSDVLPKNEDGESEVLPQLGGDVRFERLEKLLGELVDDEGEELSVRRLRPRGFRGYRDIRKEWLRIEGVPGKIEPEMLKKAVVRVQQADPRLVGDTTLFEALTKLENQIVWQVPQDGQDRPHDVVAAALRLSEIERKYEDLQRAVKLSPAHATLSRRQFLFSDLTGSSKEHVSFRDAKEQFAVVSIVNEEREGWEEKRVRLDFSAPRIERDGLAGGKGADWLPPMMKALGVKVSKPNFTKVAVALMPHRKNDEEMCHLLNFPVTLEFSGKEEAGLQRVDWKKQLNGTRDQKLHVHAPGVLDKDKSQKPWFKQEEVVQTGLQVLGVDLGQRAAASCAIIELNGSKQVGRETKKPLPVIDLGMREQAGSVSEARVIRTSSVRLPGEDQNVLINGKWQKEHYGSRGRSATEEEYEEALKIESLLDEKKGDWVGSSATSFSFPEQNDKLLKILRVLMARRRALYRLSWKFTSDKDGLLSSLAGVRGESARAERAKEEGMGLGKLLEGVRQRYDELGAQIKDSLELIGDRVLPVHGYSWKWRVHREAEFQKGGWHELVAEEREHRKLRIKGQRGLSMQRLEQVTAFRKCLLSFNRSGLEEFGEKPLKGEAMRDESTPEPCPSILKRLDELRDQRVKQTAHGIIQEALGVRLISQKNRSSQGDVHGVYEKIPGRRPVDLVVLENMQRYRASQGRGKRENSALMQWSHRAILDKVKEMGEPFGLQILEVQPDYSSRFHALTGNVGFRANRIARRDSESDWAAAISAKIKSKRTEKDRFLNDLFLKHEEAMREGKTLPALLYPQDGGTDFVGMKKEGAKLIPLRPYQADLNAAVNLALAAVAAPSAFHVFRKIRLERAERNVKVVRSNKREKEAFPTGAVVKSGDVLSDKKNQNAFFDHGEVSSSPSVEIDGITIKISTSLGIFAEVKRWKWEMCRLLNNEVLKKFGISEICQRDVPNRKVDVLEDDDDDEIPM